MALTVNVNDLTLCHKGSDGTSTATLPDVCNTPTPGPEPIDYPNIAYSRDLIKGTTSVLADGGNMCAHRASEFATSTGDEPGTLGGVTSGVNMAEASWLSFSFDVKLEGKGACRLTDKMLHNHGNTVNAAGEVQEPLEDEDEELIRCILELCKSDPEVIEQIKGSKVISRNPKKMKVRTVDRKGNVVLSDAVSGGSHWPGTIWINRRKKVNPDDEKEELPDHEAWCMAAKRSIYHEAEHSRQDPKMHHCDKEMEAYKATETWAITRRIGGPPTFRRGGGKVINPEGIQTFVEKNYTCKFDDKGKALPVQVDEILDDGTVKMDDGSIREAQPGDVTAEPAPDQKLDEKRIPPERLECPKKKKKGK